MTVISRIWILYRCFNPLLSSPSLFKTSRSPATN